MLDKAPFGVPDDFAGRGVCVSGFGSPMDSTGVLKPDPMKCTGETCQMTSAAWNDRLGPGAELKFAS
jgi:hypothetical protein